MTTEHQKVVDAHPKWSKAVRDTILALGTHANAAPAVERLPPMAPIVCDCETDARAPRAVIAAPPVAPPERDDAPPKRVDHQRAVEPWVTERELSTLMGVSTRTLVRWRKQGMPFGGREGSTIRYLLTECEAWRRQQLGKTYDDQDVRRDRRRVACLRSTSSDSKAEAFVDARRRRANPPQSGSAQMTSGAASTAGHAPPVEPHESGVVPAVEPWVDVATVARHLACTEEHVYELAKRTDSRRIPHRREGRRLLFKLSRVDAWLDRVGSRRAGSER